MWRASDEVVADKYVDQTFRPILKTCDYSSIGTNSFSRLFATCFTEKCSDNSDCYSGLCEYETCIRGIRMNYRCGNQDDIASGIKCALNNQMPCSKNEECKNPEKIEKAKEEIEGKDYNSEEDDQFNDANFIKSMKEGKYRDKHFRRFSKNNDGVEFTAFDLREENEEGHFDKNMNYIPNKEEYDPWYESVKDEIREKELLKHKRKKNEKDSEGKSEEDDKDEEYSKYGDEDLYYKEEKITKEEKEEIDKDIKINRVKLVPLLINEKETVKQAINRLKKGKSNNIRNKNKKIKLNENNNENNEDKFNSLLNIVSKLTELSFFDVYSDNVIKIAKDYGVEYTFLWKYKIIENGEDKKENIYGNYDICTMKEWIKQKYFESPDDKTIFYFMFKDILNKNNIDANKWFDKDNILYKKYLNTEDN